MNKLNTLTKNQENYIPVLRKKWEDMFYKNEELDIDSAKKYIKWLYKTYLNKDEPIVMSMKSPVGCQVLICILKNLKANLWDNLRANLGNNLGDSLRANLGDNLRANLGDNLGDNLGANLRANLGANLWDNLRANLGDNLGDNLRANLGDNLRANIGANLWDNLRANIGANLWDNLGDNLERSSYWCNVSDYGWVVFYDMIQYTNHFYTYNFKDFNNYKKLLQTGIYELYVFDGICVICEIPKVRQDEENRLHSVNEASVKWRDGWCQYFIHGVSIKETTFKKLINKKYTFEDFIGENNEEVKNAIMSFFEEKFGSEYLAKFLSSYLEEIDTYVDKKDKEYLKNTKGMNIGVYTLFKGSVNNVEIAYVRCFCPSTDRMFYLGVSPSNNNAKDAIASLYRIPRTLEKEIKYIQRQGERFSTFFTKKGKSLLNSISEKDANDLISISGDKYFNLITYEY